MTTIRQLYLLTASTLIVSIHARLYLDQKHHEMSQLESPNGIDNKLVSKRYNFAETNPKSNSNDLQAPPPAPTIEPFQKQNDKDNKKKLVLSCILGLSAAIILVVVIVVVAVRRKKNPFAFLEKKDAVSSLEIIGRGGGGEVYKAYMQDGSAIAIKKIVRPMEGGRELVERFTTISSLNDIWSLYNARSPDTKGLGILMVGKLQHRNILPLLGHVSRPDCDYLVTEYMKNGSLQNLLQEVEVGLREFDWLARHRVAVDLASGLEYMHLRCTPRIVHLNLKPANILLGNDMEAKIADIWNSNSIPDAETHMASFNVAGTLEYIAPEYHQTFEFTDKCDIYSFGVLLAVLVTGKLPRNYKPSLVKWMRNVMTGEFPKQAIDPKMLGNGYEEQMLLVLKIACFCTLDNPKKRPNSKAARLMLAQIIH